MNKTDEALQSLVELETYHLSQLDKVRRAINILTDGSMTELVADSFNDDEKIKRSVYPQEKLNKLIKQGYQHTWRNPERIMFLLKTHGKMYASDMANKIKEYVPSLSDESLDDIKEGLAYQAAKMAKKGILERKKEKTHGAPVLYWIAGEEH